ncbi:MAG: nucleotide exchange factor GrpE [Parvibaculaceae bacterium]|nr:nucleotide exchange factor GrpE [Parvibaculaceae bacterium]
MSETEKPENETPETEAFNEDQTPLEDGDNVEAFEELEIDPLEALAAEAADLKDKLLRTIAEMENLRRRSEREKVDATKYGVTKFARDMLGVSDNLRRALDSMPEEEKASANDVVKAVLEGVEMTEKSLISAFERHGIVPIHPEIGTKFDANQHEAMFEVPGTGQPGGAIIQIVETGYMIGERLLRAAKVGIAKSEPQSTPPAGDTPPGAQVDKTA